MPTHTRRKKRAQAASPLKRARSQLYVDNQGNTLFVPTEEMWLWHNATKPRAILRRAGLPEKRWKEWEKRFRETPWVLEWLYWKQAPPDGVKLVYPSDEKTIARGLREGEFYVDDELLGFRRVSSVRQVQQHLAAEHPDKPLSYGQFQQWCRTFADAEWVIAWLSRGADFPEGVTVATVKEIAKCRQAWDYEKLLASLDVRNTAYRKWLESFPEENRGGWLFWLYGWDAPEGWYVVPQKALELKRRISPSGIAEAAGVSLGNVREWWKDVDKRAALDEALEAAKHGHQPKGDSPRWKPLYEAEHWSIARMRDQMLAYARKATWTAAFDDLGMPAPQYGAFKKQAEEAGKKSADAAGGEKVRDAFVEFVESGWPQREAVTGVVAPGVFVPVPNMLRFREAARKLRNDLNLYQTAERIPGDCFRLWFLDWTLPRRFRDELLMVNGPVVSGPIWKADDADDLPKGNGQAEVAEPGFEHAGDAAPGFLELIVDDAAKVIRREGVDALPVELGRSEVMWHIFRTCYEYVGEQVPIEVLENGYPGGNVEGRKRMTNALNKRLRLLGVKVEDRRLVEMTGVT